MAQEAKILTLLADGYEVPQLADRLAKGDPRKAKRWRSRLRRLYNRPELAQLINEETRGLMIAALPATGEALTKRAERGRTDAAKLIMETSGFHNPKVDHNHSGDITITMQGMARPAPVANDDEPVVDAEVVDE